MGSILSFISQRKLGFLWSEHNHCYFSLLPPSKFLLFIHQMFQGNSKKDRVKDTNYKEINEIRDIQINLETTFLIFL
jgi:hypothetical protein